MVLPWYRLFRRNLYARAETVVITLPEVVPAPAPEPVPEPEVVPAPAPEPVPEPEVVPAPAPEPVTETPAEQTE